MQDHGCPGGALKTPFPHGHALPKLQPHLSPCRITAAREEEPIRLHLLMDTPFSKYNPTSNRAGSWLPGRRSPSSPPTSWCTPSATHEALFPHGRALVNLQPHLPPCRIVAAREEEPILTTQQLVRAIGNPGGGGKGGGRRRDAKQKHPATRVFQVYPPAGWWLGPPCTGCVGVVLWGCARGVIAGVWLLNACVCAILLAGRDQRAISCHAAAAAGAAMHCGQ